MTDIDSLTTPRTPLDWPGKQAARELVTTPAAGDLLPCHDQSINPDATENLFIEGDNLDALKHLAQTHARQIKMIYIDPPYNTGKRFIYHDRNHATTGGETNGDTHAGWLNMMYPRLLLARPLLKDDGVIFISIDDNELPRLRLLCDEVFGEDNFVAVFTWQTKRAARGVPPTNLLMVNHEYVVCYALDKTKVRFRGLDRDEKDFANPDNDARGPWRSESMKATGKQDNTFTIKDPATGNTFTANWAFAEATLNQMIADNKVLFPSSPEGTPRQKKFINTYRNPTKAAITSLGWHSTENATKQLMDLFEGQKVFDFPKPQSLLRFFCQQTLGDDDIALDFFAGSGSLAQAVIELNEADQGDRRFILVQRAEPCDHKFSTSQSTIETIAEVCRQRIARVIEKVKREREGAAHYCDADMPALGFKAMRIG